MQRTPQRISRDLLKWYDANRRVFPWRATAGELPDPYRVWLSEIMLQQTGTATASGYFQRFIKRWPTVKALASAPLDDVLREWAGLGYYARARNLLKCAITVSTEMNGEFPRGHDGLLKLPGIGPYTAAAVSAIAFNQAAPVADGNIERVMSRLHAVTAPLPAAKLELREAAYDLINCPRPGDMAQAMMDLGAMICRPRAPDCLHCPLKKRCAAHAEGIAATLPRKQPKPPQPKRSGAVFWLTRKDGSVYLRRRPEKGLLGGMMEFPGTPWQTGAVKVGDFAPAKCAWRILPGTVRHVFTHFKLELTVYAGTAKRANLDDGVWARPDALKNLALPKLMQKVVAHVRDADKAG